MSKIIYPPRPKGKIHFNDLDFYESTGNFLIQLKYNGSRNLIRVKNGIVDFYSRHGKNHGRNKFVPDNGWRDEVLSHLALDFNKEYWLDSELMNKQCGSEKKIVLFDVLQVGKYFFGKPNQVERLHILQEICKSPQKEEDFWGFRVSSRLFMANHWTNSFKDRYHQHIDHPQIEGLVLKKKHSGLDNFGDKEYETNNLIRCRKSGSVKSGSFESVYRASYNF